MIEGRTDKLVAFMAVCLHGSMPSWQYAFNMFDLLVMGTGASKFRGCIFEEARSSYFGTALGNVNANF